MLDKIYNHQKYEENIYKLWEKSDAFKPSKNGQPYTILMPPPNANASLHSGHAMYTVDDILIRWKRMQGFSALWIPGLDHAGFETQYVYEKELAKKGMSRMDFDRQTLYNNVYEFVKKNSGLIYDQFKKLGFSPDWTRSVFTLDQKVINFVYKTFQKMESEDLVYRDDYIVNYCVHDGTSLAELEVKHVERTDSLYYIKYPFVETNGFVIVATVRPEPIFADTHLAVNPKDIKNKKLIGKKVKNPLTDKEMEIIADEFVDPEFGTGIVKLTPAHDPNDFAIARKNNLPIISAIDMRGRITQNGGKYAGLKIVEARKTVVDDLKKKGLIEKIDENYNHSVITCYKCGRDLEPLVVPNWYIKVEKLKVQVKKAIKNDKVKFYPPKYKHHMENWLEIMHDWPISRQIVWGIRIPVWYAINKNPDLQVTFLNNENKIQSGKIAYLTKKYSFEEIKKGLQNLSAPKSANYVVADREPKGGYLQETDTFDTWFSSGQWPLVTLREEEFSSRFPTNTLGTLSDILKFWVSRMILFSLYLKGDIPFKNVYLWAMVADSKGIKMSKSKGNGINPLDLVEKYGADALRMSLIYGTPSGSKVILSDDKVRAMRNFANKVWNIARFLQISLDQKEKIDFYSDEIQKNLKKDDLDIIDKLNILIKNCNLALEKYKLNEAAENIYEFIWHDFADKYIEITKSRTDKDVVSLVLKHIILNSLKLLHPFMPFVTEAIWQEIKDLHKNPEELLITSKWPV